jgi:hypothetical protein
VFRDRGQGLAGITARGHDLDAGMHVENVLQVDTRQRFVVCNEDAHTERSVYARL